MRQLRIKTFRNMANIWLNTRNDTYEAILHVLDGLWHRPLQRLFSNCNVKWCTQLLPKNNNINPSFTHQHSAEQGLFQVPFAAPRAFSSSSSSSSSTTGLAPVGVWRHLHQTLPALSVPQSGTTSPCFSHHFAEPTLKQHINFPLKDVFAH